MFNGSSILINSLKSSFSKSSNPDLFDKRDRLWENGGVSENFEQ